MRLPRHRFALALVVTGALSAFPVRGHAQMDTMHMGSRDSARASVAVRAQAIGLVTRVDPALAGRAHTEAYLTQPVIMTHASVWRGHVSSIVTVDFEGLTIPRGQLNPGAYGEGYADRRHPHTYVHEAMAIAAGAFAETGVSLAAGKGFVPFGTDDPMTRPFAAYPVNHHLAQILERYVAIGAMRRGPVRLEGAFFNGDEPISPGAPPDASRFGDSWALRATLGSRRVELEGSVASVTSPEIASGGGRDQDKWSLGARLTQPIGRLQDGLIEWALTDELIGDLRASRFTSFLLEASTPLLGTTISARFENTTRPEDERQLDPFRYSRNPTDLGIIGITRWRNASVAASRRLAVRRAGVAPFVEVTYAHPSEEVTPSAFVPRAVYGSSSLWAVSAGLRLGIGSMAHRMGRYGAAVAPNDSHPSHHSP